MIERALGRTWNVHSFCVVGEDVEWSVQVLIDEFGASTLSVYSRKRRKLDLYCPIPLLMTADCGM